MLNVIARRAGAITLMLSLALFFAAPRAAHSFDIVNRWGATQLDGGGLQRGDATNLRWSIVPDGKSYERSANSNLIQFLDDGWNVASAQRTPDFTNRPWWTVINIAYAQYARVSGISMTYVAEQDAAGISTGMFGDIRIGGENLDGTPGGALADNTFPDAGDMRIDTTRETGGSVGFYFATEQGLRNLVIHETGHGVGLGHSEFVGNSAHAIMEPGLRTDIWGLQFDDVFAVNRQYGDPQERGGGNNAAATATPLGALNTSGTVSIGLDAADSVVDPFDDDWFGIDGTSDVDWFRFSVSGDSFAKIQLTPSGPTYTTTNMGGFNAAAQSDLVLQLFTATPSLSLLKTIDAGGLGVGELLGAQHLTTAGDYLLRVRGKQDLNQFYRLDVSISELPAPGTSADLNLDGVTSILDWQVFVTNSGTSTGILTQRDAFMRGDLNFDGLIDYSDLKLFKNAYFVAGGAGALADLAAVPEPSSFVLLVACGLSILGIRFRGHRFHNVVNQDSVWQSHEILFS
jgi:hypothetical protein